MPVQIDVKPTADPALLKQQAQQLQAVADDIENAAGQYARGGAHMKWRGNAANDFEVYLRAYGTTAKAQAGALRDIAAALLKGAAEIDKYRASIAKLRSDMAHAQAQAH
jgi:uncharacterized protein YukE